MGERELICIICPKGCRLKAETGENGEVLNVTGNGCRRGSEYAKDECEHPMRTVTSTMRCSDGAVISVKTDSAIPKDKIGECMKIINRGIVTLPVKIGSPVIKDVFGSNIIVTENRN